MIIYTICIMHIVYIRRGEDLKNRNKNYGKIIHACLLCRLKKEEDYGYELMSKLSSFGIEEEDINISTLYRSLKKLEDSNLIKSSWEESDFGPNKKTYSITQDGIEELKDIMVFIRKRKDILEKVIQCYENTTINDRRD